MSMQQEQSIDKTQINTQAKSDLNVTQNDGVQLKRQEIDKNVTQNQDNVEESDDDVVDQQEEEDSQLQRPKPTQIPQAVFFQDDEEQISIDDVQEQEDSMISDSQQQLEVQKGKESNKNNYENDKQNEKFNSKQKKLKLRDYQNILFNHSLNQNRIIYLPTGKGKTLVAIASMYYYLCKQGEGKKIVFLANTIQLVKQQADAIRKNLQRIMDDEDLAESLRVGNYRGKVKWTPEQIKKKVSCIHGEKNDQIGATRRKKIQAELTIKKQMLKTFESSQIIVMIAQMFLNCLRRGYIKITDFSFMVFDECHHCHGNHPYAGIMRQFYFDPPKPDAKTLDKLKAKQQEFKLPIIMGLTASPVMQEGFDKQKLVKQIQQLCGNLNSRFTSYEIQKITNETVIEVIQIKESSQERKKIPELIALFTKFRDHSQSYKRIKTHFPFYFECIKKVIDFLESKYQQYLGLESDPSKIANVELLLFYDIKQCLLIKLRDILLQLGQYAFSVAFQDFFKDLKNIRLTTQQNKQILNQVIQIIKQFVDKYRESFGLCQLKYFSGKAKKLIELLQKKTDSSQNVDKVVVFASKRRTVKYLQIIIQRYSQTLPEEQRKYFECKKVTGYSVAAATDYSKNQTIYQADPSSFRFYAEVQNKYNEYLTGLNEEEKKQNVDRKKYEDQSESKNLASQLKRMRSGKCGKLLLEVQQKYSTQIETIKLFKGRTFRVLITTSVTQEGFDIPECKMVISFDQPSSLKSYIQIKGRARKQCSKYYIFASEINYKQMAANKQFYDSIINATHEIAINRFSDKQKQPQKKIIPKIITEDQGYKRIIVRESGAVLNTRYGLQILKMFCASLRHPNKPRFFFIQTKNLAFRCLIYFPKTAPTSKPYIIGQSKQSKDLALKSAAFEAVKYLYLEKYIKADLRPKKYDEIEDQRQIQKFQDLQETRKNQQYKKIFQQQVRIRCENVTDRRFIRFYFKAITSAQLDFPKINPQFQKHLPYFETKKFPFQIYMMNFSNSRNMKELQKDDETQQIGVLTCFQSKYIDQIFSGYEYSFEENNMQKFTLKLQDDNLLLTKSEYEQLKRIHQFIVSSSLSRQVYHYSKMTQKKPVSDKFIKQLQKDKFIQQEGNRNFYPILVILKKKNGSYSIDQNCNKNIQKHQKMFKQIYQFHNYANKQAMPKRFHLKLNQQMERLSFQLKMNKPNTLLVQSLQKEHCFSKCVVSGVETYNEQSQNNKDKRKTLSTKNKKLMGMFEHAHPEIKEVLKIVFWTKYKKEKKKEIFQRDGKLAFKDVQNSKVYLPTEFCLYPLSPSLLFKSSLATQFLFKAIFQYSLAFQFRNKKLPSIFRAKSNPLINKQIQYKPFSYTVYTSVILQNGQKIFKYLSDKSSSQYLRNIGKSYKMGSTFTKPSFQFSFSKMSMSMVNQSSIAYNSQMVGDSLNISQLGLSKILDQPPNNQKTIIEKYEQKNSQIASQIKINQILKVLTSRMYKFNKVDNYQQYQFIGDVVLKMLSTVQVFLQKPKADQSQLHISRANIICNANLHRKAILKNFYRYILTKKRDQLAPPYKYSLLENVEESFYEKTHIKMYNDNTQIEGYHYIPGKVHADVIQGLIGAFYLHTKQLQHCQQLLYALDILKKPTLKINYQTNKRSQNMNRLPLLYSNLEDRIGYHFKNKGLLIQAFTHSSIKSILHTIIDENSVQNVYGTANKSFASQQSFLSADLKQLNKTIDTKIGHWQTFYERFQFLGDSILDLIVVEYLHEKFGTKDEGTLSALKQAGVSNKTLGMIAINFGMHQIILMDYPQNDKAMKQFQKVLDNYNYYLNNPEALIDAKLNSIKILGDVFQSFVGAIFIDLELDYVATKSIVMKMIKQFIVHYTDLQANKKTGTLKFQEFLTQNNYRECQLKKDVSQQIVNGNFKYLLIDRSGIVVDSCWQSTEKRAWDIILQKFYQKSKDNQVMS